MPSPEIAVLVAPTNPVLTCVTTSLEQVMELMPLTVVPETTVIFVMNLPFAQDTVTGDEVGVTVVRPVGATVGVIVEAHVSFMLDAELSGISGLTNDDGGISWGTAPAVLMKSA